MLFIRSLHNAEAFNEVVVPYSLTNLKAFIIKIKNTNIKNSSKLNLHTVFDLYRSFYNSKLTDEWATLPQLFSKHIYLVIH